MGKRGFDRNARIQEAKELGIHGDMIRVARVWAKEESERTGMPVDASLYGACLDRVLEKLIPSNKKDTMKRQFDRLLREEANRLEREELSEIAEENRRVAQTEYERVFLGLSVVEKDPVGALRWVESHPAMVLRDDEYELLASDIEDAPSRAAVGLLQHWMRDKKGFYREWVQKALKSKPVVSGSESPVEVEEEDSVEEEPLERDKMRDEIDKWLSDLASARSKG